MRIHPLYPPQVRNLDEAGRQIILPILRLALCVYCRTPFFLGDEKERTFIMQSSPDNKTFFVHEECYNARLKLN